MSPSPGKTEISGSDRPHYLPGVSRDTPAGFAFRGNGAIMLFRIRNRNLTIPLSENGGEAILSLQARGRHRNRRLSHGIRRAKTAPRARTAEPQVPRC